MIPSSTLPKTEARLMTPGQKAYSALIKALREKAMPVRARFARKAGVSESQLRDIEEGRNVGSPETMIQLARALNIRPGLLLACSCSASKNRCRFERKAFSIT